MLDRVKEFEFLGVSIQNDLKWKAHASDAVTTANKRMYYLRVCRIRLISLKTLGSPFFLQRLDHCSSTHHQSGEAYLPTLRKISKWYRTDA